MKKDKELKLWIFTIYGLIVGVVIGGLIVAYIPHKNDFFNEKFELKGDYSKSNFLDMIEGENYYEYVTLFKAGYSEKEDTILIVMEYKLDEMLKMMESLINKSMSVLQEDGTLTEEDRNRIVKNYGLG